MRFFQNRRPSRRIVDSRRSKPHFAEALERRLMLYHTYRELGDDDAVWSFDHLSYSYSNLLDGWDAPVTNAQLMDAVEESMGQWASVTPLTFFELPDSGPPAGDNTYDPDGNPFLRWGHHFIDGNSGVNVLAHGRRPGDDGINGDMHFDDGNSFDLHSFMETAIHEFGHAIGMAHANGDVVGGVPPPFVPAIMDAFAGSYTFTGLEGAFLLPDDVAGIRSLYGSGLGYVLDQAGDLNVYGTSADDILSVTVQNQIVTVSSAPRAGGPAAFMSRELGDGQTRVNSIHLHGQDGNDIIDIQRLGNIPISIEGGAGDDTLNVADSVHNLDLADASVTFNGGDGNDSIFFNDNDSHTVNSYYFTSDSLRRVAPLRPPVSFHFSGAEQLTLTTGTEADSVQVQGVDAAATLNLASQGGADRVQVGGLLDPNDLKGIVRVTNAPDFTRLNLNASLTSGGRFATIDGDGTFGAFSGIFSVIWNEADVSQIDVDLSSQGQSTLAVRRAVVPTAIRTSGPGNKILIGQRISGTATSNGAQAIRRPVTIAPDGNGVDVTVSDEGDPTGRGATLTLSDVNNPVTTLTGAAPVPLSFTGLTHFTYVGGQAADQLFVNGSPQYPLDVDMGDGGDLVEFHGVANQFYSQDLDFITIPITLRGGGGGGDVLSLNDRQGGMLFYDLDTTQIRGIQEEQNGSAQLLLNYFDFEEAVIIGDARDTRINVVGVPPNNDPTRLYTLNGGHGTDTVTIHPHTAAGAPAILSNLIYYGETGQDTLNIDDSASSVGTAYTLFNATGGFNGDIAFNGVTVTFHNDVNIVNFFGGSGKDTFNIDQFQTGSTLSISGGGDDDALTFSQASKDLANNITAVRNFVFDGGAGANTFTLFNQSTAEGWSYTQNGDYYLAEKPNYAFGFTLDNLSKATIRAGNQVDMFKVVKAPAGQRNAFFGGGGDDLLIVGAPPAPPAAAARIAALAAGGTLADVLGAVEFDGEAGDNDQVIVDDSGDSTGRVVHINQTTVGAFPGDTLFGDGASVTFTGTELLEVNLGPAADDVTAQPNARAVVNINSPPGPDGPVDSLAVDLSGVENPVPNPDGDSGGYFSDNRKPLSYTGFASVHEIITPPASVVGRHVFYNHSVYDGNDADANEQDDAALATDKTPLLPGDLATFANVTSYTRGINGIFIDVANLPAGAEAALATLGFLFSFSDSAMGEVPAPNISVRRGAGDGGSDRITLNWPDGAIVNTFLQVTMLPGPATGLVAPDIFSFGNLVGDATDAGSTVGVNASDLVRVRNAIGSPRSVEQPADFNRDGVVNASDLVVVRNRVGTSIGSPALNLVVNGGFENPNLDEPFTILQAGDASLLGWTVDGAGVVDTGTYWQAAEGAHSVELNYFAAGGISQTLATVPGQTYRIRFALAGQPNAGPAEKQLQVFWEGSLIDTESFDVTGHSLTDMGWDRREVIVTATSSSAVLRFFGAVPVNIDGGPAIDDVVVTPVAESASQLAQRLAPVPPRLAPLGWNIHRDDRDQPLDD